MKTIFLRTLTMSVGLSILSSAKAADKPAPPPSNTIEAARILTLSSQDPDRLASAKALFSMDDHLREAAAAIAPIVGVKPEQAQSLVAVYNKDPGRNELLLNVDLRKQPGVKMLASEAADKAVAALDGVLNDSTLQMLRQREQDLNLTKSTLTLKSNRLKDDLAKLQQVLSAQGSPDTIHQLLYSLQSQHETVEIDQAAKEARTDALAQQIAKFSDQIEAKIKDDPIAAELEKVVKFREASVSHNESASKAGTITQQELDASVAETAEARAKLLERREAAVRAAGGDTVAEWNREMMNLAVDLAELKARSKALAERLDKYRQLSGDLDYKLFQLQEAQAEESATTKQLEEIGKQLTETDLDVRLKYISINVTYSEDTPATTQPSK